MRTYSAGVMVISAPVSCLLGICLLAASCAGTPRKSVDTSARASDGPGGKASAPAPTARIKDSAPEKAAALRAADPNHLQIESDEQRWGIEAARERRRTTDEQAAKTRQKEKNEKKIIPLGPGSGRVQTNDSAAPTAPPP